MLRHDSSFLQRTDGAFVLTIWRRASVLMGLCSGAVKSGEPSKNALRVEISCDWSRGSQRRTCVALAGMMYPNLWMPSG
jgi:hypothetical protein